MSSTREHNSSEELLLSIIIPAYNEEASIGNTVLKIQELNLTRSEIIVVNDGSSDATARVAEAAGVKVVSHPYNIGNGAAVKTGIRSAKGRVLVFLDGDGQHDPQDILRIIHLIPKYHMVVGARTKGSETHIHRDIANYCYKRFASFLANFDIKDLTSGFRAMRREDALRFCDMFPNTFSYPTTSTLAFLRSGRSICYVPIVTKKRIGKSKIRLVKDGFEFMMIILKIAMTFSPLRIFMPLSVSLFLLGIARYAYTYYTLHHFTNMSHLLLNSSVIIFMLGLIAEQIAALRFERGDKLFQVEDAARYKVFEDFAANGEQQNRVN